jgi:alpha-N-arabinofuranosidase
MGVVKGKKYTGRIVVKGTPGARVKVALVWGEGEKDRQVVSLGPLTAGYKTVPFSFTAQADSTKASLEISGTGTGSFHVGTVSLMPADNIDGFRADTIPLLKQLNSGFWRWGGNYTSNFTWYDAIGDRDRRITTLHGMPCRATIWGRTSF